MGLSRRQFTKEFKLAAIQRREMGASGAAVARAFEINPNVLHRGRREFRPGPGNAFPGLGKRRWEEGRVPQRERKIGQPARVAHPDRWGQVHRVGGDVGDHGRRSIGRTESPFRK